RDGRESRLPILDAGMSTPESAHTATRSAPSPEPDAVAAPPRCYDRSRRSGTGGPWSPGRTASDSEASVSRPRSSGDRALVSGTKGQGFDSLRGHRRNPLPPAQKLDRERVSSYPHQPGIEPLTFGTGNQRSIP